MNRPTDEEQRFIAALRRRDPRAFNALVLKFQDRVYGLVLRVLGNPEDAREVAQEVFVSVFEKVDSYRGEAAISTWLFRIALNHARNRLKYMARRRERQKDSFDDMLVPPSSGPLNAEIARPDQALGRRHVATVVERALAELDEDQRIMVVLRDVEGQSYEDIAEITGVQLGTVKSRIHRARTRLKQLLLPHLDADDPTSA
jgi:RNA polymerase sigma-70 factor (ECF subfamily)